jgi:hypothetical protein
MRGIRLAALATFGLLLGVTRTMAACSIDQAASAVYMHSSERVADLAKQLKVISLEGLKLNAKAKDPEAPVGDQLSRQDDEGLAKVYQRLQTVKAYMILEGARGRDAQMIWKIFSVGDDLYGQRPVPRSQDGRYIESVLMSMRRAVSNGTLSNVVSLPQATDACTLDNALYFVEANTLANPDSVTTPQEKIFAIDLENLRGLWRTSELRNLSNIKDLNDSGGDIASVGNGLSSMQPGRDVLFYIDVLNDIATRYPSDVVRILFQH